MSRSVQSNWMLCGQCWSIVESGLSSVMPWLISHQPVRSRTTIVHCWTSKGTSFYLKCDVKIYSALFQTSLSPLGSTSEPDIGYITFSHSGMPRPVSTAILNIWSNICNPLLFVSYSAPVTINTWGKNATIRGTTITTTVTREAKRRLNPIIVHPYPIRMWPSNHLDPINCT